MEMFKVRILFCPILYKERERERKDNNIERFENNNSLYKNYVNYRNKKLCNTIEL